MKHLKRDLIILPWVILSAVVFGAVASVASHGEHLAGLVVALEGGK